MNLYTLLKFLGIFIAVTFLGACSKSGLETDQQTKPSVNTKIREHALSFDLNGHPVDPAGSLKGWKQKGTHMTRVEYKTYVANIVKNIEKQKPHEVLVFFHGGLNTLKDTIKRIDIDKPIKKIKNKTIYPIYFLAFWIY